MGGLALLVWPAATALNFSCTVIPRGLAPLVGEGCPLGLWQADVAPLVAPASPVFVLVGANKGYNIPEFLRLFKWRSPTPRDWRKAIVQYTGRQRTVDNCGVCHECHRPGLRPTLSRTPFVHAFEMLPQNVALLRHAVNATGVSEQVEVLEYAVAAETAELQIPRQFLQAPQGFEQAALCNGARCTNSATNVAVQAISIDDFVSQRSLDQIYQLTIDAEGWDAEILHGARKTLLARRVVFLEFEYHAHDYFCSTRRPEVPPQLGHGTHCARACVQG